MILRVATALVLIPVILLSIFFAPLWVFLLLAELFLLASLWELGRLFSRHRARLYPVSYVATFLLPWIWAYHKEWLLDVWVASVFLLLAWALAGSLRGRVPSSRSLLSVSCNLLAFFYIGIPFSLAVTYHPQYAASSDAGQRGFELVLVLATIWASDSGAFFVGKAFGRHHIVPAISPGKSLEGYVAAMAAAMAAALVLGRIWAIAPVATLLAAGGVVGAAGITGDLFESMLKRSAGVKDSSQLIPGHGGVLDRIDSLLFALPGYYLLSILVE